MISIQRTVVVIGAKGLIGSRIVQNLLNDGVGVISADLGIKRNKKIKEIHHEVNLDITDESSFKLMWDYLDGLNIRVDTVVNAAYPKSKSYGKSLRDIGYDDFCSSIDVHLGGYYLATKMFFEYFERMGGGHVINFSSIYGVVPPKFELYTNSNFTMPIEYAAIKSGIIHLTKYFAKFSKGKNIRFNSISPGGVLDGQDKDFISAYKQECLNKGLLEAEDLVGLVKFLISESSLQINGQNLVIDDGFSL